MELRKDPITRSWVITGDMPEAPRPAHGFCRFCPESDDQQQIVATRASVSYSPWSARAVVHPNPIYHIEGDPARRGVGIYDSMRTVGAHEVIVENARHDRQLWSATPEEIEQFLLLAADRIRDLKNDHRLKYVTVSKDFGPLSGQEFDHPCSQIIGATFVPRRVLYELRAAREHFAHKERCVFCDIISQELHDKQRVIESSGAFLAMVPYAPRVPYETWIIPQDHDAHFERAAQKPGAMLELAGLLRRTLNRILVVADAFHMVLHTAPNTQHKSKVLNYWRTIDEDYHWHIEIMPLISGKAKPYSFKEVYFTPVSPETAAAKLRQAPVDFQHNNM